MIGQAFLPYMMRRRGMLTGGLTLPPLYDSVLAWYDRRDYVTVKNRLDATGDSDAYLTVDPSVDIIDLSKYDIQDANTGGDSTGLRFIDFPNISGETDTYYLIENATQLQAINTDATTRGLNYILANDIIFSDADFEEGGEFCNEGEGWNPIGGFTSRFNGTFNGNGFTISNLYINRPTTDYTGLFGFAEENSTFSNIEIKNMSINGRDWIGGLAGWSFGVVFDCSSSGSISGGNRLGGLIGQCVGDISFCVSTANITGDRYVGGLAGCITGNTVKHCYSNSLVSASLNVGGLIGVQFLPAVIISSYWDTEISGQSTSAGGTGLTTTKMKDSSNYIDWDFNNIWGIDTNINDGYPYLRMLEAGYVSPFGTFTKIVSNIDNFIIFPDVPVPGHASVFDKSDRTLYNSSIEGEYYDDKYPTVWHISELVFSTLIGYFVNPSAVPFLVRATYDGDTFDCYSINQIVAYDILVNPYNNMTYILNIINDARSPVQSIFLDNPWDDSIEWNDNLVFNES